MEVKSDGRSAPTYHVCRPSVNTGYQARFCHAGHSAFRDPIEKVCTRKKSFALFVMSFHFRLVSVRCAQRMLIVVEGCVGAGKSTVAKGLAVYRGSKTLLEKFEENPFLSAFYEDPVANATETEFAFLLLHFHQLRQHAAEIDKGEVVADFHLGKDLLYADSNLRDSKTSRIFRELHDDLAAQVAAPALMICLSASIDLLLERIRRRSRTFELKIDPGYYARINDAYEDFFRTYRGRKLKLSMDEWDFVERPSLSEKLSSLVDAELRNL